MLRVNGEEREFAGGTVAALLGELGVDPAAVAVELNGRILPRERFAETGLADGDTLEIVRFVSGG